MCRGPPVADVKLELDYQVTSPCISADHLELDSFNNLVCSLHVLDRFTCLLLSYISENEEEIKETHLHALSTFSCHELPILYKYLNGLKSAFYTNVLCLGRSRLEAV